MQKDMIQMRQKQKDKLQIWQNTKGQKHKCYSIQKDKKIWQITIKYH